MIGFISRLWQVLWLASIPTMLIGAIASGEKIPWGPDTASAGMVMFLSPLAVALVEYVFTGQTKSFVAVWGGKKNVSKG